MHDVIDEMFRDGRVVNVKFALAARPVTAAALIAQLVSADRQIADGTAVRIDDVDGYSPSQS